jgi:hypothetical protein
MGRDLAVGSEHLPEKLDHEKNRWIGMPEIFGKWYHDPVGRLGLPGEAPPTAATVARPEQWTQEMAAKYGS